MATETDAVLLYQHGKARFAAGNLVEAFEAYERSCELQPTMEACANAGNAAIRLGRYAVAATLLRTSLGLVPATLEHKDARKRVRSKLSEAMTKCGTLVIGVETPGAIVVVDDKRAGMTPLKEPVFVEVGEHTITVQLDGFLPAKQTANVTAGTTTRLPMTLTPVADESDIGSSNDLRVGVSIGGIALGAVGIATGIGLLFGAESEADVGDMLRADITAADPGVTNSCGTGALLSVQCAALQDTQNTYNALRSGGVAALVAGSAFTATGLIVLLTGEASGSNVEMAPMVGPTRGGGHLRVRF